MNRKLINVNFTKGREGITQTHKPIAIVIHIMEGTMAGTDSWFRNPAAKASTHYGVSRLGDVVQWVDDADTAWANGRVQNPKNPLVTGKMRGINPNLWTLSIEHEGFSHSEPPVPMLQASANLIVMLALRHGIPLDRTHIIRHNEIDSVGKPNCPGKIDVDELIRLAKPPEMVPKPGARRWSGFFGEYVILCDFKNDGSWTYIRESQLRRLGVPATTPWSQMLLEPK